MNTPTLHQLADYVTYTSFLTTLLYSILPTVETFKGFPRFQKSYGLFLEILKQVGANLRNKVYPQIQTASGSQISAASASGQSSETRP